MKNGAKFINPKYRPDIDGLRAVAVSSVVAYHVSPSYIKGGFTGVDVFFVISGFLISTIIFDNVKRGSFSFKIFYARRVKRIAPALLTVLSATLAIGWYCLLPGEYAQLGKHTAAAALFFPNLALLAESGYFDAASQIKPLLHLWSLGVEEQFYMFWPFLLWVTFSRKWNSLRVTWLLISASFILNLVIARTYEAADFYLPATRLWELLIGALLANRNYNNHQFILSTRKCLESFLRKSFSMSVSSRRETVLNNVESILGLTLILLGLCIIDRSRHYPFTWALLPTVGAALLISAGPGAILNRVFLSNRVFVWIGLISYPLYLWHWPLLAFVRIAYGGEPPASLLLLAVVFSIALSALTYLCVERPIRFGRQHLGATLGLILMLLSVALIGLCIEIEGGAAFRWGKNAIVFEKIAAAKGEWEYPATMRSIKYEGRSYYYEGVSTTTTLFIGDSNVEQYYSRVDELIRNYPSAYNSVVFSTAGGCLPIEGASHAEKHQHCDGLMSSSLDFIRDHNEIKTVVVAAAWNSYLKPIYGSREYEGLLRSLASYIVKLKKDNKDVYVILNIPAGNELDPAYIARRGVSHYHPIITIRSGGISLKSLEASFGDISRDMRMVAEGAGAVVLNPLNYLCQDGVCSGVDSVGDPIYRDSDHLRPKFVRKHITYIDQTLLR